MGINCTKVMNANGFEEEPWEDKWLAKIITTPMDTSLTQYILEFPQITRRIIDSCSSEKSIDELSSEPMMDVMLNKKDCTILLHEFFPHEKDKLGSLNIWIVIDGSTGERFEIKTEGKKPSQVGKELSDVLKNAKTLKGDDIESIGFISHLPSISVESYSEINELENGGFYCTPTDHSKSSIIARRKSPKKTTLIKKRKFSYSTFGGYKDGWVKKAFQGFRYTFQGKIRKDLIIGWAEKIHLHEEGKEQKYYLNVPVILVPKEIKETIIRDPVESSTTSSSLFSTTEKGYGTFETTISVPPRESAEEVISKAERSFSFISEGRVQYKLAEGGNIIYDLFICSPAVKPTQWITKIVPTIQLVQIIKPKIDEEEEAHQWNMFKPKKPTSITKSDQVKKAVMESSEQKIESYKPSDIISIFDSTIQKPRSDVYSMSERKKEKRLSLEYPPYWKRSWIPITKIRQLKNGDVGAPIRRSPTNSEVVISASEGIKIIEDKIPDESGGASIAESTSEEEHEDNKMDVKEFIVERIDVSNYKRDEGTIFTKYDE